MKFCHEKALEEDDLSLLKVMKEKEIIKYKNKGIFTVKQLSYQFRPRRQIKKRKNKAKKHIHSLKALAIRENMVYVYERPSLPNSSVKIFLDVEGDPDNGSFYLIGMIVDNSETIEKYSFWANDDKGLDNCLTMFLKRIEPLNQFKIFHYGSYESKFLNHLLKNPKGFPISLIREIIDNAVNVLAAIYSRVYFPTYSNELKEITSYLGFEWMNKRASGTESILWRRQWERNKDERLKRRLLTYNMDDCLSLRYLSRFLIGASREETTSIDGFPNARVSDDLDQHISQRYPNHIFGRQRFLNDDFNYINRCAYFDYQKNKILIRTDRSLKRRTKNRKSKKNKKYSANVCVKVAKALICPSCKSREIRIVNKSKPLSKTVVDLKISDGAMKKWVVEYIVYHQKCMSCGSFFFPKKYKEIRKKYGHNLMSWVVYQNLVNKVSFRKIAKTLSDCFQIDIHGTCLFEFKKYAAFYYENLYKRMLYQMRNWSMIHADETSVRIKGERGYIWSFTNMKDVLFVFSSTRSVDFIRKLIKGFSGVFISDHYKGYDSLKCYHQKCLIHLMRDINTGLFKNQQNEELKQIANGFSQLLRTIICTVDKHGLKRRNLNKHKNDVRRFYRKIVSRNYESEVATKFIRRFRRYQNSLFTFLNHDGVPWNNAPAEQAFRHFASYRRNVNGVFTEEGIKRYLILLSVYETCKYRDIDFYRFLLSKEKHIEDYTTKYTPLGKRRRSSEGLNMRIIGTAL
jgi:transposase-like protein